MDVEKAPSLDSAGPGAAQTTGGSRDWGEETQEIVFLNWDELARYGPMWVRLHLERKLRRRGAGTVVEFEPDPHQEALSASGPGSRSMSQTALITP